MAAYWTFNPEDTAVVGGGLTDQVWHNWCDHLAREMALDAAQPRSEAEMVHAYKATNPWEDK